MVTGLAAFIAPIVCVILVLVVKALKALDEMNRRLDGIEAALRQAKE